MKIDCSRQVCAARTDIQTDGHCDSESSCRSQKEEANSDWNSSWYVKMKHGFFSIKNFIQLVSNNQLVIILTVTFISPSGFTIYRFWVWYKYWSLHILLSIFRDFIKGLLCGKLLPSGYKTVTSMCHMIIIKF